MTSRCIICNRKTSAPKKEGEQTICPACAEGRLQEAIEDYLHLKAGVTGNVSPGAALDFLDRVKSFRKQKR